MTDLSKRLLMIASFVRPGSRVADVGTDHGFLPIYLLEQGIAVHGIAMDIRKGPLSRAEEHIREAGLSGRIETRLGNGLERLAAGEADTVTIAGMGGPLMLEILQNGSHVVPSVERFVLSPQSDWRGFRLGLRELGLKIVREEMVAEDGKYYLIMEAVHGAAAEGTEGAETAADVPVSAEIAGILTGAEAELYTRFGYLLLHQKHPVLREYLLWQEGILIGILHKLTESTTSDVSRRRAEVQEDLAYVRAALVRWQTD